MGMSTINLGKSVSQVKQASKERKFVWPRGQFLDSHVFAWRAVFTCRFWTTREEMSVGKRTNHVGLEGNHCWVVFYVEKEACVPVNRVVSL
jgi:hypothetical protein